MNSIIVSLLLSLSLLCSTLFQVCAATHTVSLSGDEYWFTVMVAPATDLTDVEILYISPNGENLVWAMQAGWLGPGHFATEGGRTPSTKATFGCPVVYKLYFSTGDPELLNDILCDSTHTCSPPELGCPVSAINTDGTAVQRTLTFSNSTSVWWVWATVIPSLYVTSVNLSYVSTSDTRQVLALNQTDLGNINTWTGTPPLAIQKLSTIIARIEISTPPTVQYINITNFCANCSSGGGGGGDGGGGYIDFNITLPDNPPLPVASKEFIIWPYRNGTSGIILPGGGMRACRIFWAGYAAWNNPYDVASAIKTEIKIGVVPLIHSYQFGDDGFPDDGFKKAVEFDYIMALAINTSFAVINLETEWEDHNDILNTPEGIQNFKDRISVYRMFAPNAVVVSTPGLYKTYDVYTWFAGIAQYLDFRADSVMIVSDDPVCRWRPCLNITSPKGVPYATALNTLQEWDEHIYKLNQAWGKPPNTTRFMNADFGLTNCSWGSEGQAAILRKIIENMDCLYTVWKWNGLWLRNSAPGCDQRWMGDLNELGMIWSGNLLTENAIQEGMEKAINIMTNGPNCQNWNIIWNHTLEVSTASGGWTVQIGPVPYWDVNSLSISYTASNGVKIENWQVPRAGWEFAVEFAGSAPQPIPTNTTVTVILNITSSLYTNVLQVYEVPNWCVLPEPCPNAPPPPTPTTTTSSSSSSVTSSSSSSTSGTSSSSTTGGLPPNYYQTNTHQVHVGSSITGGFVQLETIPYSDVVSVNIEYYTAAGVHRSESIPAVTGWNGWWQKNLNDYTIFIPSTGLVKVTLGLALGGGDESVEFVWQYITP